MCGQGLRAWDWSWHLAAGVWQWLSFPVGGTFLQLFLHLLGIKTLPGHTSQCDGRQLLMLEESSLWLCIDHHSGLIVTNANNREVIDSNWTALAQPAGISPHASYHTETPSSMSAGPGANLNVTEALSGCDSDGGGLLEAMVQWLIKELCFLHLIQHRPLKTLIGV